MIKVSKKLLVQDDENTSQKDRYAVLFTLSFY